MQQHIEAALRACAERLSDDDVRAWVAALDAPMDRSGIVSARRIAAFIGQCVHESGGFRVLAENLNYSPERLCVVWPGRFPTLESARPYGRNPEKLANKVYANRLGNGDEASCDGWRFRGKGIIQLTGRDNVTRFAVAMKMAPEEAAAWLETKEGAAASATWFWGANSLNWSADTWNIDAITRRINGGTTGADQRRALCETALDALRNIPFA